MTEFEKEVLKRLSKIEEKLEIKQEQKYNVNDIPKKRNRLNEVINTYAKKENISYRYAWNDLYKMCRVHLSIDFIERAKNKQVRPIDYICGNGYIDRVLEIAKEEL